MKKPVLVCSDRDGTINFDDNFYLGCQRNWRELISFMPGVIEGIKKFNGSDIPVVITTNQAGVALTGKDSERRELNFDLLTEGEMHRISRHLIQLLKEQGAYVRGYHACPFVDNAYAKKARKKGRCVNPDFIRDGHPDLKPSIGLLRKSAEGLGKKLGDFKVYVIGDRDSDVKMGLNAGGNGILVSSQKTEERGDIEKVHALKRKFPSRVYLAKDFLEAAEYIISQSIS